MLVYQRVVQYTPQQKSAPKNEKGPLENFGTKGKGIETCCPPQRMKMKAQE